MAVTIALTTWERLQLMQALPPKGHIAQLVQALRIGGLLDLNEEEREQVGLVVDNKTGVVHWRDRETTFEVTMDTADFNFLVECAKQREWDVTPLSFALLMKLSEVSGKDLGLG